MQRTRRRGLQMAMLIVPFLATLPFAADAKKKDAGLEIFRVEELPVHPGSVQPRTSVAPATTNITTTKSSAPSDLAVKSTKKITKKRVVVKAPTPAAAIAIAKPSAAPTPLATFTLAPTPSVASGATAPTVDVDTKPAVGATAPTTETATAPAAMSNPANPAPVSATEPTAVAPTTSTANTAAPTGDTVVLAPTSDAISPSNTAAAATTNPTALNQPNATTTTNAATIVTTNVALDNANSTTTTTTTTNPTTPTGDADPSAIGVVVPSETAPNAAAQVASVPPLTATTPVSAAPIPANATSFAGQLISVSPQIFVVQATNAELRTFQRVTGLTLDSVRAGDKVLVRYVEASGVVAAVEKSGP